MSPRAAIRTGDLNRLLKAAKAHGFTVEMRGETIRLLPTPPEMPPSSENEDAEAAWDKALGLQ